MNRLYTAIGTSKQAVHQKLDRRLRKLEVFSLLEPLVIEVRKEHPRMSLRRVYHFLKPENIGRDAFERHFKHQGYGVGKERSPRRTTDSTGVKRFDNLIAILELTTVNQVWVSDITYYQLGEKFYYLTFIMDQYSRKVIGYSCSHTLLTDYTTLPALKMALKTRRMEKMPGTIFHSDGGGQYYSNAFLALTQQACLQNSMGKQAYDNPHAERINGTIKNDYLKWYNPKTPNQLVTMLKRAVDNYNTFKPHKALNEISPVRFEEIIQQKNFINKSKTENLNSNNYSLKTVNVI